MTKNKILYIGGLLGIQSRFKIGVTDNRKRRQKQLSQGLKFVMTYEITLGTIIINNRISHVAELIEKDIHKFGKGHTWANTHDWYKSEYIYKFILKHIESRVQYYTSLPTYVGPSASFMAIQIPNIKKKKPVLGKVTELVPGKSLHRKELFGNENFYESKIKKIFKPDPRQLRLF